MDYKWKVCKPLPVLVKTDTSAQPAHKGMSVLLMDQTAEGFEISKDIGKMGYKGPESCVLMFSDVKVHKSMLLEKLKEKVYSKYFHLLRLED